MVKKSLTLFFVILLFSCSSSDNKETVSLASLEKDIYNIVPHIQDNTVILSGSLGKKTGVLIPGGLVLTSTDPFGKAGDFVSVDFSHSMQLQGVCMGSKGGVGLVRIVSRFNFANGFDFNIDEDVQGRGLFVSFADRNAPRPSIRYIDDLEKLDNIRKSELDDGGALFDLNGKIVGIYNFHNNEFIKPLQLRKDWDDMLTFNRDDIDLDNKK